MSARAIVLVIFSVIPVLACGGGGSGAGRDAAAGGPDGSQPASACKPTLSASAVVPGASVTVSGVPSSIEDAQLTALVRLPDAAGQVVTVATRGADGTAHVVIPAHPTTPLAGGEVELIVGSKGSATSCAPLALTIAPLPNAPGLTKQVIGKVESSAAKIIAAVGMSKQELTTMSLDAIDPVARPLAAVQYLLDHPGNPNSLKRLMDGSAPALNGQAISPEILDGIFAAAGVLEALDEFSAVFADLGTAPRIVPAMVPSMRADGTWLIPAGVAQIQTPDQLDYWMRMQQRITENQAAGEKLLMRLGIAMTLTAGLVGGPLAVPVAMVTALIIYVEQLIIDGLRQSLPSSLDPLTVEVDPKKMTEDAQPGRWGKAMLIARGGEWQVAWSRVVDGGVMAFAGPLGKIFEKMAAVAPTASKMAMAAVIDFLNGQLVGALGGMVENGLYVTGPHMWGPFNVTTSLFTTPFTTSEGVIAFDPEDKHIFRPVAGGETTLVVRTRPEWFAGKVAEARVPISVTTIKITVQLMSAEMRPGSTQLVNFLISGAENLNVVWSASCGAAKDDGGAFAVYTAPAETGACTIYARHVTKTGRFGSATVQIVKKIIVNVTPLSASTKPGGTVQFAAKVEGTENQLVTWKASGGTIDASGLFTAPNETGDYVVTATSAEDATRTGQATVKVSRMSGYRARAVTGCTVHMGHAVDARGRVACTNPENKVAIWQEGTLSLVSGAPPGGATISDNGVLAGFYSGGSVTRGGWVMNGGSPSLTDKCIANHVNNSGQILGPCGEGVNVEGASSCLCSGDSYVVVGKEGQLAAALSNNGNAVIVSGAGNFLWRGGTLTALDGGGRGYSAPHGINDLGTVVGAASSAPGVLCAVTWEGGKMFPLAKDCSVSSEAMAVNNDGTVLGSADPGVATIWKDGTQYDLNKLLVEPIGAMLTTGSSIGQGGHLLVGASDGQMYLLTPVD